jgi:hypothetical protein
VSQANWRALEGGLVQRQRQQTSGNGALLVVVDSSGPFWERVIVDETVLVALEHFGMPYRLLDLAGQRPTPEMLRHCAGVVLAQNRLGEALDERESNMIAAAVAEGLGLINFDCDLRQLPGPLREIFGFEEINPNPYTTDLMRIRTNDHYITGLQEAGEFHRFRRMVTATIAERWRADVVALAEGILGRDQLVNARHLMPRSAFEPRNFPLLFAAPWGQGRAVQFALNVRVWRQAFHGHAQGMDDLFWRSILWAVRKPFVANMVPPLVTMSFDDCQGRHDFAYADLASRYGFIPMPSLFIKKVPRRLFPRVREGLGSGRIQFGVHGLDYYDLLTYRFGQGECSHGELERTMAEVDAFWEEVGAQPGTTLRLHWGEYGVKALPLLKERGYRYFCPALQTGLHKADMCMEDGFWPYSLQTCYYDYLPDDHDFFGFAVLQARGQEDFLSGCTAYLGESQQNDIAKAAGNAAGQIRHGLRGAFPAEILTHEQKFDVVSMAEWEDILRGVDQLTTRYERSYASHDEIGAYLQGKDGLRLDSVVVEDGSLRCALGGHTAVPLRLSVFVDEGDEVRRDYSAVDAFCGSAAVLASDWRTAR